MECTREEFVNQAYDIHVCFSDPDTQITTYTRLRFALQASSWFPRPLGIVFWSVLHVLLLVGGASLLVLQARMMLVLTVMLDILLCAWLVSIWLPSRLFASFIVCVFKLLGLGRSFFRFSWSLICENGRLHRIRGASSSFVAWWAHASWYSFAPRTFWEYLVQQASLCMEEGPCPPPWTSLRCVTYLVGEGSPWYCRVLTRWSEEVVHKHDAIAI